MESRHFRTRQKKYLKYSLSCPIMPRLHTRSRLYEFGVYQRNGNYTTLYHKPNMNLTQSIEIKKTIHSWDFIPVLTTLCMVALELV